MGDAWRLSARIKNPARREINSDVENRRPFRRKDQKPSAIMRLRSSLRVRLTASFFFLTLRSEGFS